MNIQHLNCGTFHATGGQRGLSADQLVEYRLVCHCLLITTHAGLIAVDTGFGMADVHNPQERLTKKFVRVTQPDLTPERTLQAQLFLQGIPASALEHIIVTHLDVDHIGGLSDFPEAHVHLSQAELSAATQPGSLLERGRYRKQFWDHNPDWVAHDFTDGDAWFGFPAVSPIPELAGTLLLVSLPGHTRGHCGVAIDCGDHWLLHAGDAFFRQAQLYHPEDHSEHHDSIEDAVAADNQLRLATLQQIQQLAGAHRTDIKIFCAHDPVGLQEFTEA